MAPEVIFILGVLLGGLIGACALGSFWNLGVKIGLIIASVGGLVWLLVQLISN